MTVINSNVKALYTQGALKISERQRATAMQQLSTGKRINSAKDDAAGLAIVGRMTQNIKSMNQAVRNAGDAISLIQTTEGATNEITNMLQRMSELAIQSSNATYSPDQRGYLNLEFQQLKQEIVRVSQSTQWNDFPVLNGAAGAPVGPQPVYKTTSQGSFNAGLTYAAGTATTTNTGTIGIAGTFAKSGTVNLSISSTDVVTATLTLEDGTSSTLTGTSDATAKTITFANTALTGGAASGSVVISSTTQPFTSQSLQFKVGRSFTAPAAMQAGDVSINGTAIGASTADSDTHSIAANAAGSAIAKAAAINLLAGTTHVGAAVNPNVMSGSAMSGASALSGTVTINGFVSAPITSSATSPHDSRVAMVNAINAISAKTGVVASDTGTDTQGISLAAADGRNIEVAFNTVATASSFSAATGLKEGIQSGSYSLANAPDQTIAITSTSAGAARTGLNAGSFSTNQSTISTTARAVATTALAVRSLGSDDLLINGVAIRAATSADDSVSKQSTNLTASSLANASAIATAAAINASSKQTGVSATANPVTTSGSTTTIGLETGTQSLYINGVNVQVTLATTESTADRRLNVITAINGQLGQTGVLASDNGNGGINLSANDGRNLSVWYDTTGTNLSAASFGLGNAAGITGAAGAGASYTAAATIYGTVSLVSDKAITLAPGVNGFGSAGDFSALGFQAGTAGGVVDPSNGNLPMQRTGRLSFQVGPSADQVITIDLSDFGKNGTITGALTGDVDQATPSVNINTVEGANAVIDKINKSLDQVSATRATMGAVMNRLEHVIDNLTNVSTNTEASRSRIEDADYAAASTELARTQIMQQAATAVLAQANTDQQTVMKLLQ